VWSRRTAGLLVVLGFVVSGCSDSGGHDGMGDMEGMGDMSSRDRGSVEVPAGAEFNAADVSFSQGMVPHHGQAVRMADMALEISSNPEVRAIAEQIQAAQGPEIEQMSAWLTAWDQDVPDQDMPMDDMDHSGGMMMSGMMSAAEMGRLGAADGAAFDRMWLEMMVRHHEGAIEMAEQLMDGGKYGPTRKLAEAVIEGQQAEIEEMNALLGTLGS